MGDVDNVVEHKRSGNEGAHFGCKGKESTPTTTLVPGTPYVSQHTGFTSVDSLAGNLDMIDLDFSVERPAGDVLG